MMKQSKVSILCAAYVLVFATFFNGRPVHAAATITAGSATVAAGNNVTIPVSISGLTVPVRSFLFILTFNGTSLTNATGVAGAAIPSTAWSASAFSPNPGTLNALGFELGGGPALLNGELLSVTFTVPPGLPSGSYTVTVAYVSLLDANSQPVAVSLASGTIIVGGSGSNRSDPGQQRFERLEEFWRWG